MNLKVLQYFITLRAMNAMEANAKAYILKQVSNNMLQLYLRKFQEKKRLYG